MSAHTLEEDGGLAAGGHADAHGGHAHADAWHHHTAAEGLPQSEHGAIANTGTILQWLALIILTLVILVVALVMYFGSYVTKLRAERVETNQTIAAPYQSYRTASNAELGVDGEPAAYLPLDPAARTVRIPLDQAIRRVAERYAAIGTTGAGPGPMDAVLKTEAHTPAPTYTPPAPPPDGGRAPGTKPTN